MKNGARFGATSQQDPTDVTYGRLKDSDLERRLKRREMALWALAKKRQFSPFLGRNIMFVGHLRVDRRVPKIPGLANPDI
jgi:hypothetical protein